MTDRVPDRSPPRPIERPEFLPTFDELCDWREKAVRKEIEAHDGVVDLMDAMREGRGAAYLEQLEARVVLRLAPLWQQEQNCR
jgi:hypothetical protein